MKKWQKTTATTGVVHIKICSFGLVYYFAMSNIELTWIQLYTKKTCFKKINHNYQQRYSVSESYGFYQRARSLHSKTSNKDKKKYIKCVSHNKKKKVNDNVCGTNVHTLETQPTQMRVFFTFLFHLRKLFSAILFGTTSTMGSNNWNNLGNWSKCSSI